MAESIFNWTTSPRATGSPRSPASAPTTRQPAPPAPSPFELPYVPEGYSPDETSASAWTYAQGKQGYYPHKVQQEGSVTYQNGVPGIMVKYNTPQGTSTEWTPLSKGVGMSGWIDTSGGGMPGGGGGGGGAGGISGGFMGDPILAQTQALVARQRSVAQSAAAARRAQAAIEYGDPSGIQGLDEKTMTAARDNPFSVLKNLERGYETGVRDLEENLNASNLFYSGYRGTKLGEAATDYQGQRSGASSAFRGLLTDVENALAQALLEADWMEMSALQAAYARALSQALDYGYGYPGGGQSQATGGLRDAALYATGGGLASGAGKRISGTPTRLVPARSTGGGLLGAMMQRGGSY